jgi:hypothetical protein
LPLELKFNLVSLPFIPVVSNQKGIESTMPFDTNHPLLNVILQWALILGVLAIIGAFVGAVSSLLVAANAVWRNISA